MSVSFDSSRSLNSAQTTQTTQTAGNINELAHLDQEDSQISRYTELFMFPLFAEISYTVKIPQFIYFLHCVVQLIQIFASANFLGSQNLYSDLSESLKTLYSFIDLGVVRAPTLKDCLIQFLALTSLFAIVFGWVIFVHFSFQSKRIFNKYQLYITRFVCTILMNVFAPFYSSALTVSLKFALANGDAYSILWTCAFCVQTFFCILLFVISNQLTTETPILCNSKLACWDWKVTNHTMVWISACSFLGPFADILQDYLIIIFVIICFLIFVSIAYRVYFYPFLVFRLNYIIGGYYFGCGFIFISVIVRYITKKFDPSYHLITEIVFIVIFIILYSFFTEHKKNKITALLTLPEDDKKLSESEKYQHFDNLVFSSSLDVYRYLHIGLIFHCQLFVDISFQKYLIENYAEPHIVLKICQIVSFFPNQVQFLSYLLGNISQYKNLSLSQRFLVYQMRRTHQLRQSYVSNEAKAEFQRIKRTADISIGMIRTFWSEIISKKKISLRGFREIAKITNQTTVSFYDALEKFPNNTDINEEFCRFLIEGAANFSLSIDVHKKSISQEIGRRTETDRAFVSMVNFYPEYLTLKILDTRGNFIDRDVLYSFSSDSSYQATSPSSSSDNEFDAKRDEIMRTLFNNSRQRITIQSALQNTQLHGMINVVALTIAQFVIALTFFLVVIFMIPKVSNQIAPFIRDENRIMEASATFQYIAVITGIQVLQLLQEMNMLYFDIDLSFITSNNYLIMHQQSLINKKLTHSFYKSVMANAGRRMVEIETIFNTTVSFYPSNLGMPINISLKQAITMLNIMIEEGATFGNSSVTDQEKTEVVHSYLYNIITNSQPITDGFSKLTDVIIGNGRKHSSDIYQLLIILGFSLACIFFFVFGVLQTIVAHDLTKSVGKCLEVLGSVKPDAVRESFRPISLKNNKTDLRGNAMISAHQLDGLKVSFPFFVFLFIVAIAIIFIYASLELQKQLSQFDLFFDWIVFGGKRIVKILETTAYKIQMLAGPSMSIETPTYFSYSLKNASIAHSDLLMSLTGTDDLLDKIHFSDKCPSSPTSNFSEYMECLSLGLTFDLAEYYLLIINSTIKSFDSSPCLPLLMTLIEKELFNGLFNFQDSLVSYSISMFDSQSSKICVIFSLGITIILIFFAFVMAFIYKYHETLIGVKQMIRILPPNSVFQNTLMVDFILNSSDAHNDVAMTPSEAIIAASSNAIIMISFNEIIQNVNEALKRMTGFTPDQVLGQQISWIFPLPEDGCAENDVFKLFYEALDGIKQDTNRTDVINTKILTENGELVHVKATIICAKGKNNDVESIVIFLRDMTQKYKQKKSIKESKKKTEFLLSKLVPSEVLSLLLTQKGPSKYSSENATVVYVELNGMIDYVHSLPPNQLISYFNQIYEKFDEIKKKYPAVHTIKTNDDLYVACAGLFDYKDDVKLQVNQVISFCCSINDEVEDINDRLSINLQLRFGINFGGPLYGSILNATTPTFDMMGDIINDAVRMQQRGELGVVQITESVRKQLDKKKFLASPSFVLKDDGFPSEIQVYTVKKIMFASSYAVLPSFVPDDPNSLGLNPKTVLPTTSSADCAVYDKRNKQARLFEDLHEIPEPTDK